MQLEQNAASGPLRLILVEDSDADAYLVGQAAQSLPCELQVTRFATAAEAVAGIPKVIASDPHGVLLDLNLPAGTGLDVLKSIRDSERTRHLPVVVMTSSISPRDREDAERLGIEGYLIKQSDYNQFVDAVDSALQLILRGAA